MTSSAIVTGGTGGLGSAVVARLLDDGWRVVVPWVAEHELKRAPQHDRLQLIQADLFDPQAVAAVAAAGAADPTAPLTGLVNLVGGFAAGSRVHETPIDTFEAQFRLNLRPAYLVTQAVLPHLIVLRRRPSDLGLEPDGGASVRSVPRMSCAPGSRRWRPHPRARRSVVHGRSPNQSRPEVAVPVIR